MGLLWLTLKSQSSLQKSSDIITNFCWLLLNSLNHAIRKALLLFHWVQTVIGRNHCLIHWTYRHWQQPSTQEVDPWWQLYLPCLMALLYLVTTQDIAPERMVTLWAAIFPSILMLILKSNFPFPSNPFYYTLWLKNKNISLFCD